MSSNDILEFDVDTQKLAKIKRTPRVGYSPRIIKAENGGVPFAALSCAPYHQPWFQIWERKVDSYGVATWVLRNTIELQKILGLGFRIDEEISSIVGYVKDVRANCFAGCTHLSISFSLGQCSLRNFLKTICVVPFVLSQVFISKVTACSSIYTRTLESSPFIHTWLLG
jgi:hypothetical protein